MHMPQPDDFIPLLDNIRVRSATRLSIHHLQPYTGFIKVSALICFLEESKHHKIVLEQSK
jgi:hypothetical protein